MISAGVIVPYSNRDFDNRSFLTLKPGLLFVFFKLTSISLPAKWTVGRIDLERSSFDMVISY